MILLAVLLIVAYVASALSAGAWWDLPATELLGQGASFAPAIAGGESWRLLSALFLHGGLLHLLFNLAALIEIGRRLERRIGRLRPPLIFLLAGSWGFLLSLLWQPEAISVGASGGIFGLLGSWAVEEIRAIRGEPPSRQRHRQQLAVLFGLLLALGLGLLLPNVDNAAHLGGLVVGLLLGAAAQDGGHRRLIFPLGALALAGGLWLATTQLPASWKIEFDETHEYAERYRRFAEEDRKVSEALQAIGEASRRNVLTDAEGLAELDRELLPRLAELAAERRQRHWQTARLAQDAERWASYAALRLAAVTALRNAIASDDPAHAAAELQRFELLMTQAALLAHRVPGNTGHPAAPPAR